MAKIKAMDTWQKAFDRYVPFFMEKKGIFMGDLLKKLDEVCGENELLPSEALGLMEAELNTPIPAGEKTDIDGSTYTEYSMPKYYSVYDELYASFNFYSEDQNFIGTYIYPGEPEKAEEFAEKYSSGFNMEEYQGGNWYGDNPIAPATAFMESHHKEMAGADILRERCRLMYMHEKGISIDDAVKDLDLLYRGSGLLPSEAMKEIEKDPGKYGYGEEAKEFCALYEGCLSNRELAGTILTDPEYGLLSREKDMADELDMDAGKEEEDLYAGTDGIIGPDPETGLGTEIPEEELEK